MVRSKWVWKIIRYNTNESDQKRTIFCTKTVYTWRINALLCVVHYYEKLPGTQTYYLSQSYRYWVQMLDAQTTSLVLMSDNWESGDKSTKDVINLWRRVTKFKIAINSDKHTWTTKDGKSLFSKYARQCLRSLSQFWYIIYHFTLYISLE